MPFSWASRPSEPPPRLQTQKLPAPKRTNSRGVSPETTLNPYNPSRLAQCYLGMVWDGIAGIPAVLRSRYRGGSLPCPTPRISLWKEGGCGSAHGLLSAVTPALGPDPAGKGPARSERGRRRLCPAPPSRSLRAPPAGSAQPRFASGRPLRPPSPPCRRGGSGRGRERAAWGELRLGWACAALRVIPSIGQDGGTELLSSLPVLIMERDFLWAVK